MPKLARTAPQCGSAIWEAVDTGALVVQRRETRARFGISRVACQAIQPRGALVVLWNASSGLEHSGQIETTRELVPVARLLEQRGSERIVLRDACPRRVQ